VTGHSWSISLPVRYPCFSRFGTRSRRRSAGKVCRRRGLARPKTSWTSLRATHWVPLRGTRIERQGPGFWTVRRDRSPRPCRTPHRIGVGCGGRGWAASIPPGRPAPSAGSCPSGGSGPAWRGSRAGRPGDRLGVPGRPRPPHRLDTRGRRRPGSPIGGEVAGSSPQRTEQRSCPLTPRGAPRTGPPKRPDRPGSSTPPGRRRTSRPPPRRTPPVPRPPRRTRGS